MIAGRLETQKVTIMWVFLQKPLFGAKARTLVVGLGVLLRGRVQYGPQSALGLISKILTCKLAATPTHVGPTLPQSGGEPFPDAPSQHCHCSAICHHYSTKPIFCC